MLRVPQIGVFKKKFNNFIKSLIILKSYLILLYNISISIICINFRLLYKGVKKLLYFWWGKKACIW